VVSTHVCRGKGKGSGAVTHLLEVVARAVDRPSLDVLGKYVPGSDICHDAPHLRPEIVSSVFSRSRRGIGLAGKAARNDVNNASPRSAVKRANVIPNGERRQESVVLSLHQDACAVVVALDGADGSPSEEMPAENSSTSAREKSQLMHALPPCFPSAVLVLFASVLRL
jgi:hypothetical protein